MTESAELQPSPRRNRRRSLGIVLIVGSLILVLYAGHLLGRSRQYQLFGQIVSRVDSAGSVVALTLDDGPTAEHTDDILGILRDKSVRATFFLVGQEVLNNLAATRRIIEAGHEVGNHSFSHERMLFQSLDWMRDEIERTDTALRSAGWNKPALFRPPYGKKLFNLPWVLSKMGKTTVTWDVEPESNPELQKDPAALAGRAIELARPGSIILLHAMYPSRSLSRRAIAPLIDGLRKKGLEFVTVSELLARRR